MAGWSLNQTPFGGLCFFLFCFVLKGLCYYSLPVLMLGYSEACSAGWIADIRVVLCSSQ